MAQLGRYTQQIRQQTTTPGAAPVRQPTGLGELGTGLVSVAQAVNVQLEREARDYTLDQKNKISVEYAEYQNELARTATSGTEYLEGINSWLEKKKKAAADSAPGVKSAEAVTRYLDGFIADSRIGAMKTASAINAENAARVVQDTIDIATNEVFVNPNNYERSLDDAKQAILVSDLPENQKAYQISQVEKSLKRSQVLGEIRNDPYKAVIKLSQGDMGLEPAVHERMFAQAVAAKERAQRELLSRQSQNDKLVKQQLEMIYSETAKDGDERLAQGQLTYNWVTDNRANLSDKDYRYFLNKLDGSAPKATTNREVYVDLYERSGDGEDITAEARDHYIAGELTQADYKAITSRYESSDELPSAYKQGEQYLRDNFRPSELNPSVGSQARYANVTAEWRDWYASNPNATVTEAMAEARQIENRYRMVELDDMTSMFISGPKPIYLEGSRQSYRDGTASQEGIRNTANATFEAYQEGKITEDEFKREQLLIVEWNKMLNQAAAARAQAGSQ